MNSSSFFQQRLGLYRNFTLNKLLEVLPSKEPRRYLYDLMPDYPKRSGKGLRAALCMATCNAYGGNTDMALITAVAIELFHNGFLLLDDIQDESLFRRGESTFYKKHGIGMTINVANAFNLLSFHILMKNRELFGSQLSCQIFKETEEMLVQTLEGQAMELGWIKDNVCDLTDRDYFRMALKKSSWYTCIYPCRIGGLIATGGAVNPDSFFRFGCFLGIAFQIQDDVLNLVGDYEQYGKEIQGDIWEGKRTLMLIHLLTFCSKKEKKRIKLFLSLPREERLLKDIVRIYRLMLKYGSIEYARKCAQQFVGAALYEYFQCYGKLPDSDDKKFILEMILYMIERDH